MIWKGKLPFHQSPCCVWDSAEWIQRGIQVDEPFILIGFWGCLTVKKGIGENSPRSCWLDFGWIIWNYCCISSACDVPDPCNVNLEHRCPSLPVQALGILVRILLVRNLWGFGLEWGLKQERKHLSELLWLSYTKGWVSYTIVAESDMPFAPL